MVELNEKAGVYAEKNVINVLKEAFAKVYADGYRDGYKDCEVEIPIELKSNQTEFVDLGLPSGTLWSADFEIDGEEVKYLPYEDAEKYGIPTKEQFNELLESCKWEFNCISSNAREYTCIGPNGNHIVFSSRGYKLAGTKREIEKIFFWVKSTSEDLTKEAVYLYYDSGEIKKLTEMFSGCMLPLRLVKNN